ncbi:MAG TPA: hypothetical protein V6D37_11125 [Candidatus Sericytochromatia bacterium]
MGEPRLRAWEAWQCLNQWALVFSEIPARFAVSLTKCVTDTLFKRPPLVAFRLLKIGERIPRIPSAVQKC